jgi:hypothetical protein
LTVLPEAARPTIRCLRQDLGYAKLPPASLPLDRLDLPVLRKAQEACRTDPPSTGRISSIDDQVLWKVKIERWRGVVWCDLSRRWLVAAGRREAGSSADFYADLTEKGKRWRAEHNRSSAQPVSTDTLVSRLLPAADDQDRTRLEQAVAAVDEVRSVVRELVIASAVSAAKNPTRPAGAPSPCWYGALATTRSTSGSASPARHGRTSTRSSLPPSRPWPIPPGGSSTSCLAGQQTRANWCGRIFWTRPSSAISSRLIPARHEPSQHVDGKEFREPQKLSGDRTGLSGQRRLA